MSEISRLAVIVDAQLGSSLSKLKGVESQFWRTTSAAQAMDAHVTKSGRSIGKSTMVLNKVTKGAAVGMVAGFALSAKAAVDWESAFTGVRKTIDGSEADFKRLETGIRSMATKIPVGATALAGIAESAGQLGIKKSNILGFTRVVADMGVATNLAGEEGASMMAGFANITGMAQGNFDRLGSTIVALGNNGASTEADIAAMGLRIAAAGKQVGMTEAQTLGYANALSSLKMEAEAGGTAMSRIFKSISKDVRKGGDDLNLMAKVSGMSAAAFKKNFQTDAAGATQKFLQGLGKMQKSGGDVLGVLEKLKFDDVRVSDAIARLSGNSQVLADSLSTANDAWGENTALQEEAARRYATTASQLQILKNHAVEAGISVGTAFLPSINTLARFGVSVLHSQTALNLLGVAAGALVGRMAVLGAVWAVGKVGAFVSALGQVRAAIQLIGMAAATGQLRSIPAMLSAGAGMGAVLGPLGMIAGAAVAAGAAFGVFSGGAKQAAVTAQDAADAVNNYKNAMLGLSDAKLGVGEAKMQVAAAKENLDVMKRQGTTGIQLAQAKQALTRATLGQMQAEQRLNDATANTSRTTRETVKSLVTRAAQLRVAIAVMAIEGKSTAAIAAKQREYNSVMKQMPAATAQASRGAQNLIKQYGNMPKVVKTVLATDSAASLNTLDTLASRLTKIAGKKTTAKILGNADNAKSAIDAITAKLNSLDGKTASTYVNTYLKEHKVKGGGPKARALGGRVRGSEALTLVGERGPEIVSLPTGSYVHPNGESMQMLRDAGMESFAGGGRKKGKGLSKQEKRDRWNERIQSRSRVLDLKDQRSVVGSTDMIQAERDEATGRRHLREARSSKGKGRAEAIQQALLEIAQAEQRQREINAQAAQDAQEAAKEAADAMVQALADQTAAMEAQTAAIAANTEESRKNREFAERVHTATKSVTDKTLQAILDKTLGGQLSQMMLTLSPRMAT